MTKKILMKQFKKFIGINEDDYQNFNGNDKNYITMLEYELDKFKGKLIDSFEQNL